MNIYDTRGHKISLTQNNFLAEGGEGKLYADQSNVYKIYLHQQNIIALDKMIELKQLNEPTIIRPLDSIYDDTHKRVGFLMKRIPDPIPLARLFTSAYWQANGVTIDIIYKLVKKMQATISFIHRQNFLQVDGNEFNYLIDRNLKQVYFIDVDSFQTPGFPASAIMPSIRDYTQDEFNQGSDWFSFAIIAFQLFVGIHPFKGRAKGSFKHGDFEARIKAGLSVLNSEVSYPSSVRDFALIPKNWMGWFEALFERGERGEPPTEYVAINSPLVKRIIKSGDRVVITELQGFSDDIGRIMRVNGQRLVWAEEKLYVGKTAYNLPSQVNGVLLGKDGKPLFLAIQKQRVCIVDSKALVLFQSSMAAQKLFVTNNIAYVLNDDNLVEVKVIDTGKKLFLAPGTVRKILPNAISLYTNVLVENIMGKTYLLLPNVSGQMPIVAIKEMDSYRIIDGRYENQVAVFMVADKQGKYQQVRIRFNPNFSNYDIGFRDDVDDYLNFAVLDKGVVIYLLKDGRIEVTSTQAFNSSVRIIEDKQVGCYMKLANDGGRLAFFSGNQLFSMHLISSNS